MYVLMYWNEYIEISMYAYVHTSKYMERQVGHSQFAANCSNIYSAFLIFPVFFFFFCFLASTTFERS